MESSVRILETEIISDNHFVLKNVHFEVKKKDGTWEKQVREVFDHGDGVTVLLYNRSKRTVVLIEQFRITSFINGNEKGTLIETCAGLLEEASPEEGMKREIEEETGYEINNVQRVFELYMSPGADTEKLYFFVAEYSPRQRVSDGGGLEEEQEEIDVLELPFDEAYSMIEAGEIKDAKTVLLLQYAKLQNLV